MNDQFAFIDSTKVRYRDSGGAGPAILMTHGIGESLEFWHRQFESLGPSMRLIAWDMPGHGLSDESPEATSLEGQAQVAWKLLDRLGVGVVHLVGNSLGAAMSIRMASQEPARVASMLLANSAALGPEVFGAFKLMTLPLLGELMTKPGPAAVAQQIKAIVYRSDTISPEVRTAIQRNVHRPGGARHFLVLLRGMTTLRGQRNHVWMQSHAILQRLQMPILVVHGENDSVLPEKHSRVAHARAAGSQLVIIPDCGHTPQLEQPKVFNDLLQRLIQSR